MLACLPASRARVLARSPLQCRSVRPLSDLLALRRARAEPPKEKKKNGERAPAKPSKAKADPPCCMDPAFRF
jgi:hypothetical protein